MLAKARIPYAKIKKTGFSLSSQGIPSAVGMTNRDIFSVKGVFE